MRTIIRNLFLGLLVISIIFAVACKSTSADKKDASRNVTSISFWTYPIGNFSDSGTVNKFIRAFNKKYPDIKVNVEYLNYNNGDDQVIAAMEAHTTPDVIMEGPERLVSNWAARGHMLDISDMWTAEKLKNINKTSSETAQACRGSDGKYYEYPLCITAHSMAINYQIFKKAGALKYLDLKNRTWTTAGFIQACKKIADSGLVDSPAVIYCGGQGGDQGTRALVTNLYNASFTNAAHTRYTINNAAGIRALKTLTDMKKRGYITCNSNIQASDELKLFAAEKTAMTFAWNASNEANYVSDPGFTPYAMTFPSDSGQPELCSGIWGFGIFDNGSDERASAARKFIHFICDDSSQAAVSVRATGFFPSDSSLGNVYEGTAQETLMSTYSDMQKYIGDYYSITPGWAAQRTAWWNMLQQIFSGTDPETAADLYVKISNNAADKQ